MKNGVAQAVEEKKGKNKMEKYFVMYDNDAIKGLHNDYGYTANMAKNIDEKSYALAPDTYILLSLYAEKFMLVIDEDTDAGRYFSIGINALAEMGYIEIGGECENDDYKMIWIVK